MNQLGFTKQVGIFFYEVIKFLCWLLPLLFLLYLALSFFLFYLFPDFPIEFSERTILSLRNFDLGVILLLMFLLTVVGIYIRQREKKIKVKLLRFKSRDELIVALVTAFFFSTFFIKSFFELKKFEAVLILFSTLFFLALLPQFVLFYSFIDLNYFKKLITDSTEIKPNLPEIKYLLMTLMQLVKKTVFELWGISFFLFIFLYSVWILKNLSSFGQYKFILIIFLAFIWFLFSYLVKAYKLIKLLRKLIRKISEKKEYLIKAIYFFCKLIKAIVIGLVVVSFIAIIVAFLAWQLNRYADYQRKLRENLTIMSVVPVKTTLAQKVKLQGYNFGWRVNKKDKLMSNYGPVLVDEWKGEELIFIVPLHWKEGKVKLWIEKNKDDIPEEKLIKSNVVRLKVLSRWDFFPAEEELRNKDPLSYLKRAVKKIRRTLFLQKPYFQ